jgi:4-deoxy-L-threo-5-hexosulose-uronate ketol-isomerase
MGSEEVVFEGEGARFYLASVPAHKALPVKLITLAQANPLERGDLANSNQRTIYQLVIPGVCESAQLLLGLTVLEEGSVWNTMPPTFTTAAARSTSTSISRRKTTACSTTWASPTPCATS